MGLHFYLWLVSSGSLQGLLSPLLPRVPGVDETWWDGHGGKVSLGTRKAEGASQKPSLHESGDWAPSVCGTEVPGAGGGQEGGRPALDSNGRGPPGGLSSTDVCQALFCLSIFMNSFSFPQ